MGIKEDYMGIIENKTETVYYESQDKKKKFKFVLKPIKMEDLLIDEFKDRYLVLLSQGQTKEEIARILAEEFKAKYLKNPDALCSLLFSFAVKFPKIVQKTFDEASENELPFSLLDLETKTFLLQNIMKISPIFQMR